MPKTSVKKPETKKAKVKKPAIKAAKPEIKKVKPVAAKPVEVAAPVKSAPKVKSKNYFYAFGKRKTAGASVRLITEGTGVITINGRTFENYFPVFTDQDKILTALRLTNTLKTFDISVKVAGGGIHCQAEAVRHGISRALLLHDATLRGTLKSAGYLTRDSRTKERKKYGLKRARRAPQWQKR
jgi:small subunit ribosomal protein S9